MATILLTGAAGFIGFHTAKVLKDRGDTVICVDNFNEYYDINLKHARHKVLGLEIIKADAADKNAMTALFEKHKFDKVCHLAAQAGVRYSLERPDEYINNNLATVTLLELARLHNVPQFVFASSSSVYGGNEKIPFQEIDPVQTPISVYAATKRADELFAHVYHHLYKLKCTGLRFFTVYGPWGRPDMALFSFVENMLKGEPINIHNNGKHRRDFTYVKDIVQGVIAALDNPQEYEIFNLGRGAPVDLMDFIKHIEIELGIEAKKNLLPMQPGDVEQTHADISKAKELIGYNPTTNVEEGIKEFIKWYKEYYQVQ